MNVVDLRTGLDQDLTLSVPFEGELPIPETGVSSFNRGTSSEQLYAPARHAIWINSLQVKGERLTVVVGHGSDLTAVTFDLSAMLAKTVRASQP